MENKKPRPGILQCIWNLEKKFKLLTYFGLLFLTYTTWNLKSDYKDLNEKYLEVSVKYEALKVFSNSLVTNMVIYNRTFEDFPLPVWGKVKRNGRFPLQYLNQSYVDTFGHLFNYDRYSIFGKDNFQIFKNDKAIAQMYYENDITVSITGIPLETVEYAKDSLGKKMTLKVLKWRSIKDNKDTIVYGMVKDIIVIKEK